MTRMNIIKQYFFNTSITNYGFEENETGINFLYAFLYMSQEIEPTIKETSKTNSFLEDKYKNLFKEYFYGNITELVKEELTNMENTPIYYFLVGFLEFGFSSVNSKIFEILKFLTIRYFMDPEIYSEKNISNLINHDSWIDIHNLLLGVVRPWYQNIKEIISSYYDSYTTKRLNFYIYLYVILLILISLYYWIVWKHYEDELINSIQKSFDLINLIPEEIKNIIINKLNEN
jgi:hypothetical protein